MDCERRQQLELRIIESEAALNIMGRIFEDRTAELVLVRSKLDIAECRTAELEKRMGLSTTPMNHADSKLHDVTDTPLLPTPLGDDDQRQVCSIFGQMAAAFLDCDCDLCLLQAAHGAEMEDIVHKQKNLLLEIQMICKAH